MNPEHGPPSDAHARPPSGWSRARRVAASLSKRGRRATPSSSVSRRQEPSSSLPQYIGDWMLHCHLPHHMMNQMVSMVGPMTHAGEGLHAGMGMTQGMGMVTGGHALSEELGPGLGAGAGRSSYARAPDNPFGRPSTTCKRVPGPTQGARPRVQAGSRVPPRHVDADGRAGNQTRDARPSQRLDGGHDGHDGRWCELCPTNSTTRSRSSKLNSRNRKNSCDRNGRNAATQENAS